MFVFFLTKNQEEKTALNYIFDRREHYLGYNRMAKNQSDSCNFLYLMTT